jgi:hypothetical protein
MRIEVVVFGWEQSCCGKAFARGDTATVSIHAADPTQAERDAPARFLEERHGQTPADVPQREVTGTVARISGVNYERRRRPGPDPVFDIGEASGTPVELEDVAARSTGGFDELRLLLDVPDGVVLPSYVESAETGAADERATKDPELARRGRSDAVGTMLDAIADEAVATYSSVAGIERADDRIGVTIEPNSPGAASISWARYTSADSDLISVRLGEGRFSLPADVEHASELRELVAAAAAGRVRESVRNGKESTVLETVAHAEDGRTWTDTVTEAPSPAGGGIVLMASRLAGRLQAGDHGYEPWTA